MSATYLRFDDCSPGATMNGEWNRAVFLAQAADPRPWSGPQSRVSAGGTVVGRVVGVWNGRLWCPGTRIVEPGTDPPALGGPTDPEK